MVLGEQISANTKCSASQTAVVPLGERLGVPSGQTVTMKLNCCSSNTRRISSVTMPIERCVGERSAARNLPFYPTGSPSKTVSLSGSTTQDCLLRVPPRTRTTPPLGIPQVQEPQSGQTESGVDARVRGSKRRRQELISRRVTRYCCCRTSCRSRCCLSQI